MEFKYFVPILIIAFALVVSILEIMLGFKAVSKYFQSHFVLKNNVLKRIVVFKPLRYFGKGDKRQEISLFGFIPYAITMILSIIAGILTIIFVLVPNDTIGKLLSNKVVMIILITYVILNLLKVGIINLIDGNIAYKEWKQQINNK